MDSVTLSPEGSCAVDVPYPGAVLDALPEAVVVVSSAGFLLQVNPVAEELLGRSGTELVGCSWRTLVPASWSWDSPMVLDPMSVSPECPVPMVVLTASGPREVTILVSWTAAPSGDQCAVVVIRSVRERPEQERLVAVSRYLRAGGEVALRLGAYASGTSAPGTILDVLGTELGCVAALYWEESPRERFGVTEVWTGKDHWEDPLHWRLSRGEGLVSSVWESRVPLWVEDIAHREMFAFREETLARQACSALLLPVLAGDDVLGVVELFFPECTPSDPDLLVTVATVGRQVGQFMARLRAEERSRHQLAFLASATSELEESLDLSTTMARLADLCVPTLADECVVDVLTNQEEPSAPVFKTSIRSADTASVGMLQAYRSRYPLSRVNSPFIWEAFREGTPVLVGDMEELTRSFPPEQAAARRALGWGSFLSVPIRSRGETIGTITLGMSRSNRTFTSELQDLAAELGRRAGITLENARLYSELARTAARLQDSLLPPSFPMVEGLEFASRYIAAGTSLIGGDFFDVFEVQDAWAITIGDVAGKGGEAAALTGLVRHTLRGVSLHETSPARILSSLNDALVSSSTLERFITALFLRVEPSRDGATFTLASGGHPLPWVLRRDGSIEQVGTPGMMIGAFETLKVSDVSVFLSPGDKLLLYTDGVTERRRASELYGDTYLPELLAGQEGATPQEIVSHLERSLYAFDPDPRDDVAMLCVGVPSAPLEGVSHLFPCDRRSVAAARLFVEETLHSWGRNDVVDVVELLTSEVVTNAVIHAGTDVELRLRHLGPLIRVEVGDYSPALPVRRAAGQSATGGRGLSLVASLAESWGTDPSRDGKFVWFEIQRALEVEEVDPLAAFEDFEL